MKAHLLFACLIAAFQFCPLIQATLPTNDYKNSDIDDTLSGGSFEEFRQPLYVKRSTDNLWQLLPFPQLSYQNRVVALRDLRDKRAKDNPYDLKKSSIEMARLRQRFYNLLR